jgi:hypothetical protein
MRQRMMIRVEVLPGDGDPRYSAMADVPVSFRRPVFHLAVSPACRTCAGEKSDHCCLVPGVY